jgi:leader peptidase (prepilin peptidase)/N-methyltransferase
MDWAIPALGFAAGTVLASYAGALAYRLPRGASVFGRSRCEGCGRPLRWFELVPVAGWLLVKGRCPACGYRVPPAYPASEFLLGVVAASLLWRLGPGWEATRWIVALAFLWAAALADLGRQIVPNGVCLRLAVIGCAGWALAGRPGEALWALLALPAVAVWAVRPSALGGGDVKLVAALGACMGPAALPALFLGSALAAAGSLRRGGRPVPLAPFLLAGAASSAAVECVTKGGLTFCLGG